MATPTPEPSRTAPTVYVSYSHDSPEHQERVVELADRLRRDGIIATIDKYEPGPPEGWPRWIEKQLRDSDFVLMVCTETYRRRFDGEEEPGRGQGITFEGKIITQLIYEASPQGSRRQKWVPVLFDESHARHIPAPVRIYTYYDLRARSGYQDLLDFLRRDDDAGLSTSTAGAPKGRGKAIRQPGNIPKAGDDGPVPADGAGADDEPHDGAPFDDLAESDFTPGAWSVLQLARRLGESRQRPQVCTVRRVIASLMLWGLVEPQAQHTGQWLTRQTDLGESDIKDRLRHWYPAISTSGVSFLTLLDTEPAEAATTLSTNLVKTVGLARRLAGASSDPNAGTHIAARHLLAAAVRRGDGEANVNRLLGVFGLSAEEVRARMIEELPGWGVDDDPQAWSRLVDQVEQAPDERGVPIYAADSAIGPDLIGITREVEAMAALMCAWSVEPPLSIGLFGEWGSGKSFFMQKIKERVRQIASAARKSGAGQREFGYYKNIVQVEFNAWHYVEGNLWASLVEHIFTNLRLGGIGEEDVDSEAYLQRRLEKLLAELREKTAEAEDKERMAERASREAEARKVEAEGLASRLETKAAEAREQARTAEVEQRRAENTAAEKQRDADASVAERDRIGIRDLLDEVVASTEIRSQVQEDLGRLGITPERMQTVQGLREALQEASDSGTVLAEGIKLLVNDRGRWWLLASVLAAPAVAAGLVWVGASLIEQQNAPWLQSISGGVSMVATVLAAALAFYKRYSPKLRPLLDIVGKLKQKRQALEEAVEKARQDRVARAIELDREVQAKRAEAAAAARRASDMASEAEAARRAAKDTQDAADRAALVARSARAEADQLQRDAGMLLPERRIAAFIQDRAGATDYRRHLGVPALVRRDFEKLSAMFHTQRAAEAEGKDGVDAAGRNDLAIVNRIILYIDDLDRCPPQKVVEVLRAIHLLLAFPLFVVVVAVDARWMKRSLRDRFSLMLTSPEHDGRKHAAAEQDDPVFGQTATPDDYLEKIFQVPFWIRPLSKEACRHLVNALTKDDGEAPPPAPLPEPQGSVADDTGRSAPKGTSGARLDEQAAPVVAGHPPTVPGGAGAAPSEGPGQQAAPAAHRPTATPADQGEKAGAGKGFTWTLVEPKPRTLQLTKDERDYMVDLAPIIGRSPRSVKRFVNCYRLLKSALDPDDLARVTRDGTVQTVMVLLGLVTGLPDIAPALLTNLRQAEKTLTPVAWAHQAGKQLKLEARKDWGDAVSVIEQLGRASQLRTIRPLVAATDLVDRFSFSPVRSFSLSRRDEGSVTSVAVVQ